MGLFSHFLNFSANIAFDKKQNQLFLWKMYKRRKEKINYWVSPAMIGFLRCIYTP